MGYNVFMNLAATKNPVRPDEDAAEGGCGGIPPRPSEIKQRPAPPPCSQRAEHHKKVFFSF